MPTGGYCDETVYAVDLMKVSTLRASKPKVAQENRNEITRSQLPRDSARQRALAQFNAASRGHRTIALVTHNREGGVLHHVMQRSLGYRGEGAFVLLLRPGPTSSMCEVSTIIDDEAQTIVFVLPAETEILRGLLLSTDVKLVEFHHFIGHNEQIFGLIENLGVPYDVFIHDYSWICPRITLTTGDHRYCGEPKVVECEKCVRQNGSTIDEIISPRQLRERSMVVFEGARSIIVPSADVSRRMRNQMAIDCVIQPWEELQTSQHPQVRAEKDPKRRVCIVGAIGFEKGYNIILQLAWIIKKFDLPMEIIIVGFTCDDQLLLETGCVTITGRYEEDRILDLVREQNADIGFFPSLWPETWSYALSHMLNAGLFVVAYDIGTPSERIRLHERGIVIPLHLPLDRLASLLLAYPVGG